MFPIYLPAVFVVACSLVIAQEGSNLPGSTPCPVNLTECIKELEATLPSTTLDKFKSSPETITRDYDLSLGIWICNNWILGDWHFDSPLARYFKKLGIDNAEDISGIVLTSLWRDLHSQPLRLEEQLSNHKKLSFYKSPQITEERSIPENVWNQELQTYSGQVIRLADFKGKPFILLIFDYDMATPSAISSLNSIRKTFDKNELQILGLLPSLESMDKAKQADFLRKTRPLFPLVFECTSEYSHNLANALITAGSIYIPEIILIGRDGKMITRFHGWDSKETPQLLEKSVHDAVRG